jgi:hypothetical protein
MLNYANENWMRVDSNAAAITTFAYQYDGIKRTESTRRRVRQAYRATLKVEATQSESSQSV